MSIKQSKYVLDKIHMNMVKCNFRPKLGKLMQQPQREKKNQKFNSNSMSRNEVNIVQHELLNTHLCECMCKSERLSAYVR